MVLKKYSIVIVSWNVRDLLIQSISDFVNRSDVEIIIIDNNSNDDSVEAVRSQFPEVTVVDNKVNLGFAGGNNQGFEMATGEYVFILNPDTICTYEALQIMGRYLDENPQCGAVGPKIFYGNGVIQKSCARRLPTVGSFFIMEVLRLKKVKSKVLNHWMKYPYKYDQIQSVEAISGAAILIRGALLKQLKGFDEIYLHTGEDIDLCKRVVESGADIIYNPESSLIHLAGQSSKQDLLKVMFKTHKSSYQYFKQNSGVGAAWVFWGLLMGIKIPVDVFYYFIRSKLFGKNEAEYKLNSSLFKKLTGI
ncbi:glycosyltransferase family 2 protein [Mucilaginibacter phyllosphaerae]|uniref:Glycosyltransferase family 2 protein n=1 Tax=Mucilaginibacter phyllosphaerae TaxID=1812349 RepID=A0A4Y8AHH5_9SPHI|nr:glycosyltransferase family 2 protein [Mucilaginibacter phyllosphaerae]MBB3968630.1 hypothetical protein [Mucilaginibacter phyllosphaerae]TEW67732.1 glycosyltransferase family 2 protein [Mucilaginibacter phyllosphaerae]GGH14830.1 glycosyl transferase [Mucilaginibacter phyllosphaerae]